MGKKDSSLTRVAPVFDHLFHADPTGTTWLSRLISLPVGGHVVELPPDCNMVINDHGWGSKEKHLKPPVALLSWLIRNPRKPLSGILSINERVAEKRRQWIQGSSERILEGLSLLRHNPSNEDWHIFEGETQPDVYIETDDLILVIEGKRTEYQPTTTTKWMSGRHQMLRHLDCAWEIRGNKNVLGFFIVEGHNNSKQIPSEWLEYASDTISPQAIASSLPHRSPDEQNAINSAFIGVTTWQQVCHEFDIDWSGLPDEIL